MWGAIDLVLRFGYVALVPFMLPLINEVIPIGGLLIGTGIATTVALVGSERWRVKVESLRFVGRPLSGFGRLGEFYASFPPKPLVYYILYPLLLPVILFMRIPRREFFLYRKLNVLAMVVIATTGAYDYFEHWRPELTFQQFASAALALFILQLLVTFMFIMPIVTTLIELRLRRRPRTLALLAVLMLITGVLGVWQAHRGRTMSMSTWLRIEQRTKYARDALIECVKGREDTPAACIKKDRELRAMADAIEAASDALQRAPKDEAGALAIAREKLAEYYKPDEADAFRLAEDSGVYVVYAKHGRKPAIWVGLHDGKWLIHARDLPAPLRKRLGV